MPQFHTVIPIYNVQLDPGLSHQFSGGLVLGPLPAWVHGQNMLDGLSAIDRDAVMQATHAFVLTHTADALGSPDPDWKGANPKSIQETKYEVGVLANLALWLARPSPVCFGVVLHAPQFGISPTIQQTQRCSELLCHPSDIEARITDNDLPLAAKLHKALLEVPRDTATWTAVRAAWAGLQMNIEIIRCLLFWVALEALFGPEDGREITYRLSQRVGFFLGANRVEARQLFETAKAGYGFRSKIVHGVWKEDVNATKRMAEAFICLVCGLAGRIHVRCIFGQVPITRNVHLSGSFSCPRCAQQCAEALARGNEAMVDEMIDLLDRMNAIPTERRGSADNPEIQAQLDKEWSAHEGRIRTIGRSLNDLGGKDLMLRVHSRVRYKAPRHNRFLDGLWDGIGDWLG